MRTRVALIRLEQVRRCGLPRVRTIHVASGAHGDDARKVDEPGDGGAEQDFENRAVFLRRHAVEAGARS